MAIRISQQSSQIGSTGFAPTTRSGTKFRANSQAISVAIDDLRQYQQYIQSLINDTEQLMADASRSWRDEIYERHRAEWLQSAQKLQEYKEYLPQIISELERKLEETKAVEARGKQ